MMTLQQAAHWAVGTLSGADGQVRLSRVVTDSRAVQPGDLFVALKGERFDAHDFVADVLARGAVAALVAEDFALDNASLIKVDDTRLALGRLASGWAAALPALRVGITGSNGKTTVKEMLSAILKAHVGEQAVHATAGNFNNDIGVPLMLLRLTAAHRAAVIEMGMNHPGEIARLAAMAQPTVALVNNAQREHLEFMHTVEAVARENGSVFASLPADGVAVFPAGDAYTGLWQALAQGRRTLTFGEGGDVVCQRAAWEQGAWAVEVGTPQGGFSTRLHIAGRHNVTNALAAAACALAAGVPLPAIAQGLQDFVPVKGRSRAFSQRVAGRDITVVDDTYNANPDSMRAALDVLAELPGPQLMVMGDMGEVGDQGPQFHAEAGALAREAGIPTMFVLGAQSVHAASAYGDGARHFNEMAALQDAVRQALPTVGSVLVKGSRFMKMEQVVEAISAAALPAEQQQKPINPREGHHGATH